VSIFLSEVVIGVDMADSVTMKADELRGSVLPPAEIGMANIQGQSDFRKGIENGLKLMGLGEKVSLGKHIFNKESDIEVDRLLQYRLERFHRVPFRLVQQKFSQPGDESGVKHGFFNSKFGRGLEG